MKSVITSGLICVKDKLNLEYFLAKIEYQVNEDETFEYRFFPYYNVIELLDSSIFQGIPGLDLDLKKEVYIRKNKTPVFISERAPSENRENLIEMLESVDMDYLNQLEWLIRTNLKYSGDNMYVKRYEDNENVQIPLINNLNTNSLLKRILSEMCKDGGISFRGQKFVVMVIKNLTLYNPDAINNEKMFLRHCLKEYIAEDLKVYNVKFFGGCNHGKQK